MTDLKKTIAFSGFTNPYKKPVKQKKLESSRKKEKS